MICDHDPEFNERVTVSAVCDDGQRWWLCSDCGEEWPDEPDFGPDAKAADIAAGESLIRALDNGADKV